jgi:hypothetical protein
MLVGIKNYCLPCANMQDRTDNLRYIIFRSSKLTMEARLSRTAFEFVYA